MADDPLGCAQPTGSVVGEEAPVLEPAENETRGVPEMVTARVGGKAPDFEAPAYMNGKFFNVKLSDYSGKWVLLCFYPGDFTFV